MYLYILNLRAIKRERKWQIILTATKKEKYIIKKKSQNGNLCSKKENIL